MCRARSLSSDELPGAMTFEGSAYVPTISAYGILVPCTAPTIRYRAFRGLRTEHKATWYSR